MAESMRQSLSPKRSLKLEHVSTNLTPWLKFIFERSARLVTTRLKSFLPPSCPVFLSPQWLVRKERVIVLAVFIQTLNKKKRL